jgi:hypothetical protein
VGRAIREQYVTRVFAPGTFHFVVETNTEADRDRFESLFQDVPPPTASASEPAVISLRRTDGAATVWEYDTPQMAGRRTTSLAHALSDILSDVNLCALDAEPEHLHVHAAAATKDGRAAVMAAQRDTGKTTTVAHLVAAGWHFITDETVRLPADSDEITGFPKPLSIKPGGRALVEHLEPWMVPAAHEEPDLFGFVSVGASGGQVAERGRPHLVLMLRRFTGPDARTKPLVRALEPADAVVALMQETLDAERFGFTALRLAQLAAASHCFELTLGSPRATVDEIERLSRLEPVEELAVSELPLSDAFRGGVVSIAIGDRIVVHNTRSGMIFALHVGAATVWRQLGGLPVDEAVDVNSAAIRPFVDQLRSLGVLAGAA